MMGRVGKALALASVGVAMILAPMALSATTTRTAPAVTPGVEAALHNGHPHGEPSTSGASRSYYGSPFIDLAVAKLTTARFRDLDTAKKAGYTVEFVDRLGFTCISDLATGGKPSQGAMGVHYVNPAYIGSTDPAHPAAVLYEPGKHGAYQLVGLEYLVVEPQQPVAPAAFGQRFMFTPAGDATVNRFMPDAFYSLHVWNWKHNPAGKFAMWNRRVHCPA
ncbi:MAG: hypothetical protein ABWX96_05440 [Propionibacteriaceae bacterium]